jgi:hypothetical protein
MPDLARDGGGQLPSVARDGRDPSWVLGIEADRVIETIADLAA